MEWKHATFSIERRTKKTGSVCLASLVRGSGFDDRFFLDTLILALLSACHQKAVDSGAADTGPVWLLGIEDQALQRGLNFHHQSGSSGKFWTPEIMTGGAALADLDGDGDLDAYLRAAGARWSTNLLRSLVMTDWALPPAINCFSTRVTDRGR